MPKIPAKIVVFDLDETLGHFSQLGLIWDAVTQEYARADKPRPHFDTIMALFPEYQRPGVTKILQYLVGKKHMGACNMVMIYTNNQGPREWAMHIRRYFENLLGEKLFDRIIAAFKVDGRRVEPGRTSHDKTVSDLISCTQISHDTQICFIDDQHHPRMEHENVYYIRIKPYVRTIPFASIASRLESAPMLSDLPRDNRQRLARNVTSMSSVYPNDDVDKTKEELEVDAVIGKRVLQHIQEFFKLHERRQTRRRKRLGRRRSKHTTRKSSSLL